MTDRNPLGPEKLTEGSNKSIAIRPRQQSSNFTMRTPSHILTVVTRDHVGIIAGITGVLDKAEVQLFELSQTVVWEYFTIILVINVPKDVNTEKLNADIFHNLGSGVAVTLVPYQTGKPVDTQGERYVLTATGIDRPGIIHTITEIIAQHGGNFTDLSTRVADKHFSMVAEIDLPEDVLLDQLQIDLQHAGAEVGLQVRLQHNRLFVATNEIAFRRVIDDTK